MTSDSDLFNELYGTLRLGTKFWNFMTGIDGTEQLWRLNQRETSIHHC